MKKILFSLLYYGIAFHLPCSYYPGGRLFTKFRAFCVRYLTNSTCYKLEIEARVLIGNGRDITIGNYCQINEECRLRNVVIGNYVMIAPQVIIPHSGHSYDRIDVPMRNQSPKYYPKTIIEDDVWIGSRAIIMHGLRIGKGSIIAAGSVVTKDVEPLSIVGGNPAIEIRKRH